MIAVLACAARWASWALAGALGLWQLGILASAALLALAGETPSGAPGRVLDGLWFLAIQDASLILTVVGWPVVGALALCFAWRLVPPPAAALRFPGVTGAPRFQWRGGALTFLWGNLENGIVGPAETLNRWNAFVWSALRNSANNLRYLPGVSKAGRPLWYRTWTIRGRLYYAKAGWLSDGYPCLSFGAGKGY